MWWSHYFYQAQCIRTFEAVHNAYTGSHLDFINIWEFISKHCFGRKCPNTYVRMLVVAKNANPGIPYSSATGLLHNIPLPGAIVSSWYIDTIDHSTTNSRGYSYILSAVCDFSGFAIPKAVKMHKAVEKANF